MTQWFAIDGETPIDPSMLLDELRGIITNRQELIPYEARNVLKATVKFLGTKATAERAPFDLKWMCEVHESMFDDVWKWAGQTRKFNINIGIHHTLVTQQLLELSQTVSYWQDKQPFSTLDQAVRLHHRCAFIHPFPDGNGRWARLLTNIYLELRGDPVIMWPTDSWSPAEAPRAMN